MTTEIIDIISVIALSAFAGGTSFIGALMSKYINFAEPQILFLTAFGAEIRCLQLYLEFYLRPKRLLELQ